MLFQSPEGTLLPVIGAYTHRHPIQGKHVVYTYVVCETRHPKDGTPSVHAYCVDHKSIPVCLEDHGERSKAYERFLATPEGGQFRSWNERCVRLPASDIPALSDRIIAPGLQQEPDPEAAQVPCKPPRCCTCSAASSTT